MRKIQGRRKCTSFCITKIKTIELLPGIKKTCFMSFLSLFKSFEY